MSSSYISGKRAGLEVSIGTLELEVLEYEISGGYLRKLQPQLQGVCAVWDTAKKPSELRLVCETLQGEESLAGILEWLLSAHTEIDFELDGAQLENMFLLGYSVKGDRRSPAVRCELKFASAAVGGVVAE